MQIECQSIVIFVRDIQVSRRFYEGLLCQPVTMDFGVNVELAKRFALWQVDHALETIFGRAPQGNEPLGRQNAEVVFETEDIDALWSRLAQADMVVSVVHPIREQPWGQRVFRVYDPDGHLVEIGEPMAVVIRRLLSSGLTVEAAAAKTGFPPELVSQIAAVPAH